MSEEYKGPIWDVARKEIKRIIKNMEETKSDKQILLAEHKKANDALREIKLLFCIGLDLRDNECTLELGYRENDFDSTLLIRTLKLNHPDVNNRLNIISNYLSNQFKSIMKSNKTIKTQEFKPIKTKGFSNKDNDMAYAKKTATKKPAAKPTKKVSKKTTAKKTSARKTK